MEHPPEAQQAAQQTIAEITADLGPSLVLGAVADAIEQMARTEGDERSDALRL